MTSRPRLVFILCGAVFALALLLTRHRTPAISTSPAPARVHPDDAAAVDRTVAERNRQSAEQERAFRADGWEMVAAAPPDPRLSDIDPTLISTGRERDLRFQLASTIPSPAHARRVADVALLAHEPETRAAAIDALARMGTTESKTELLDLLAGGRLNEADDEARRNLPALVRPVDLDDPIAGRMAALLDSDRLTAADREQLAFTLALVSLRDGTSLPDAVLATMSPAARDLLERMTEVARRHVIADRQ